MHKYELECKHTWNMVYVSIYDISIKLQKLLSPVPTFLQVTLPLPHPILLAILLLSPVIPTPTLTHPI